MIMREFDMSARWRLGAMLAAVILAAAVAVNSTAGLAFVGAVFLLAGIAILANSPHLIGAAAYVALALMFVDISPVSFGGSAVRLYQPLSVMLIAGALIKPKTPVWSKFGPILKWLVLFTALVVVSYTWTISPSDTLVLAVGQSYLLLLFAIVCSLLNRGHITVPGILTALWVGAFVTSLFAVAQFFSGFAGFTWQLQRVTGIPWARPAGLMLEPDWAAVAAGIGFMLALYRAKGSKFRTLSLFVFGVVLIVTGVRAVWLATVVICLVLLMVSTYGKKIFKGLILVATLVGVVVFFIEGYFPGTLADTFGRLNPANLSNSESDGGALDSRLGVLKLITDQADENAALGHGAGSLAHATSLTHNAARYVGGGELNAGRGSANLFATSFWDTGWVGVAVVAALTLSWLLSAWRARKSVPVLLPIALFLLADFQANNGIRFGFVWVLMALASWSASQFLAERREHRRLTRLSVPHPRRTAPALT